MSETSIENASDLNTETKTQKIVFLGDSLAQSGQRPDGFLNLLRQSFAPENSSDTCLFDLENLELISAGMQRDKVAGGLEHLEKMQTAFRPDGLVIMLGLYDVWQQDRLAGGVGFAAVETELRQLLKKASQLKTDAETQVPLFVCTPMLIGEKPHGENSLDGDLDQMAAVVTKVASEIAGCKVVDLRATALDYLAKNNPNNRPHSILTIDGVHLNHNGHRLVAAEFARQFGVQLPQPVERQLRHIVLLKFGAKTPHNEILELVEKFKQLDRLIPSIESIESERMCRRRGKQKVSRTDLL